MKVDRNKHDGHIVNRKNTPAIDNFTRHAMELVTQPRRYEIVDSDKENARIAAAEAKRERKRNRVA